MKNKEKILESIKKCLYNPIYARQYGNVAIVKLVHAIENNKDHICLGCIDNLSDADDIPSECKECISAINEGKIKGSSKVKFSLYNEDYSVKSLKELKKEIFNITVDHFGGNKLAASNGLGVSRATLYRILDE